jgi:hypothetical protein
MEGYSLKDQKRISCKLCLKVNSNLIRAFKIIKNKLLGSKLQ